MAGGPVSYTSRPSGVFPEMRFGSGPESNCLSSVYHNNDHHRQPAGEQEGFDAVKVFQSLTGQTLVSIEDGWGKFRLAKHVGHDLRIGRIDPGGGDAGRTPLNYSHCTWCGVAYFRG